MAKEYKTLIDFSNKKNQLDLELKQLQLIDSPSLEMQAKIAGINVQMHIINEEINKLNSLVE